MAPLTYVIHIYVGYDTTTDIAHMHKVVSAAQICVDTSSDYFLIFLCKTKFVLAKITYH